MRIPVNFIEKPSVNKRFQYFKTMKAIVLILCLLIPELTFCQKKAKNMETNNSEKVIKSNDEWRKQHAAQAMHLGKGIFERDLDLIGDRFAHGSDQRAPSRRWNSVPPRKRRNTMK